MNYVVEVEKIRVEIMKRIEDDSNFVSKLSKETGIGMYAIFSLIHQSRPTRGISINKIKTYLDKEQ